MKKCLSLVILLVLFAMCIFAMCIFVYDTDEKEININELIDIVKYEEIYTQILKYSFVDKKTIKENPYYKYIEDIYEKIEPYNNFNVIFYNIQDLNKQYKSYFPVEDMKKYEVRPVDYKVVKITPTGFYDFKIEKIQFVREEFGKTNLLNANVLTDEKGNIIKELPPVLDCKVYNNKLMIAYLEDMPFNSESSIFGFGGFYVDVFYLNQNVLTCFNYHIPKFVSSHTGNGIVRKATFLSENFIECYDMQQTSEIYRLVNTKSDYEKNIAMLENDEDYMNEIKDFKYMQKDNVIKEAAKDRKLVWSDKTHYYQKFGKDGKIESKKYINDKRSHDFIDNEDFKPDLDYLNNL